MAKIYVASSWRNEYYPEVVEVLRKEGHDVYDFRNPPHGGNGFHWTDVDENATNWTFEEYAEGLNHPLAEKQFQADIKALYWANICVLVLPCGRSAHLEAGFMTGIHKRVIVYMPEMQEPELMYKLFDGVTCNLKDLCSMIRMQLKKGDFIEPVNLGLSVRWANRNVGASSLYDPGEYIGWKILGNKLRTVNSNGRIIKYAPSWRPPTKEEVLELIDNCTREEISIHGHRGEKFTGPTGESIFLPYGGYINPTESFSVCDTNQCGVYLSRKRTHLHSTYMRLDGIEPTYEPEGVLDLLMNVRLVLADDSK